MGSVAEFADLRREVERLRAENARLARLLELRGQDTSAAPEQLSALVEPPGLVTMASPTGSGPVSRRDEHPTTADDR
ncbi:hypothetical protein TPA0907_47600 [Micromonospora humidisoli]|uniref:hypothetical protein n=1 Tax=Micromonospora sp. AKA109 TaxID=2733865 RepID=UPI0022C6C0F6|nr:hypothetical protein [Micromonospora sp. AKA109]GHJ10393.1 hypothetical protein TPA0907_47600 [Micromonospora sp. AKA109]